MTTFKGKFKLEQLFLIQSEGVEWVWEVIGIESKNSTGVLRDNLAPAVIRKIAAFKNAEDAKLFVRHSAEKSSS